MSKRRFFTSVGKIFLSGILAFIILTGFCYFYYNVPVHSVAVDGVTDYRWEPGVFYSRGTEGFAWGKTNNEGYINLYDFTGKEQIDILIMGSSHMEAYQVAANESVASRLDEMLPNDRVYNIGVSGHSFLTCAGNLEAAINKYRPSKYVIIETNNVIFDNADLSKAIDGNIEEVPSHTGGMIGFLQKNQYLRLIYSQLQNYRKKAAAVDLEENSAVIADNSTSNGAALDILLSKLNNISLNGNVQLIILYHPNVKIDTDGSLQILGDLNSVARFEKSCRDNNILFLDMSERFLQEYESGYVLPYGFANSTVGSGHLNRYGHAMIADALYELMGGE